MSPLAVAALAVAAASTAGALVGRSAHRSRTRQWWWVAAVLAGAAAVPAAGTPVAVGTALAGAGLVAAAVVDAAEGRIPTPVAHATTGVSAVALVGHGVASGEWGVGLRAVALTGGLAAGLALLWLAGAVGFGDVRLAGGLMTAMTGGVAGLAVLVYVALAIAVAAVLVRRATGRRGGSLPFGPALVLGWVGAVATM